MVIDITNSVSPKANDTKKISRKCECILTFGMAKLSNEIKINIMLIIDIKLFTVSYIFCITANFLKFYNSSKMADSFSASHFCFMHDFLEMQGSQL